MWVCAGRVLKATAGVLRIVKWVCVGAPTAAHGITQSWVNKWWNTGPCEILGSCLGSRLSYLMIISYCFVKIIWISHAVKTSCVFCLVPSTVLISLSAAFSQNIQKNNFAPSCFAFFPFSRKTTKESLAESASNITESLMGISRMMSQQVQQSEETVQTLGTAGIWAWVGWWKHLGAALSAWGQEQSRTMCYNNDQRSGQQNFSKSWT